MNQLSAIAYGCDIDRDPQRNRANHQAMVDRLNAELAADGWPGVEVVSLFTSNGSTFIEIEPGKAVLTLDLLRGVKEAGGRRRQIEQHVFDGDQGRLV